MIEAKINPAIRTTYDEVNPYGQDFKQARETVRQKYDVRCP